jgi:UTP--glucose-1-phosphate uridylyltransferase
MAPVRETPPVRKAVIPAAGLGTRFLPFTKAVPKEMLPIVDKPALQYIVEEAVGAGIDDILIVTGRNKQDIEDHFDRSPELEAALERSGKHDLLKEVRSIAELANVHSVRQGEPKGLGHAVSMARAHVGGEPFAVMLGDDLMIDESKLLREMTETFQREGASVIAFKAYPPTEISAYGVAACEPVRPGLVRLTGIVEKPSPEDAPSDLAVMGRYVFTPEIFDALDRTEPGKGGEIQLTDAIAILLKDQPVYGLVFEHGRYDAGNKIDFLRATVDLALDRPDLAGFRDVLADIVRREGIR